MPAEKNQFSNNNDLLLFYIVEEIEDKPYVEIVKQRIIDKLDLKNIIPIFLLDLKKKLAIKKSGM